MTDPSKQTLFITATFTGEPIKDALNYWMTELKFPFEIKFAPYNQVFQQLLDPTSSFSRNEKGINIVLLRLEDWQRFENADVDLEEKVQRNTDELLGALQSAAIRSASPTLVCLCPASPSVVGDTQRAEFFRQMEMRLQAGLEPVSGVYLITSNELTSIYPVKEYYDAYSDQVGHIPYTTACFTALATMLARKIYVLQTPARKVIVLDCDNTLWKGICGESGPTGVEIDAHYQALQKFMVSQYAAGRLLCLCSKNSETDVFEVFAQHPEMLLRREHIISSRINWQPKSENLIALAKELNVGLDSFIFLDDNPVECAEVQTHCPEVLTLQLPEKPERIPRFLQHAWPFDYLKVTETDRQRTELYRQNLEREQLRDGAANFEAFLAALELEIRISEMTGEQVERVAQLTQRTNQFNVSTIRRTESEIQRLSLAKDLEFLVVEVRDRFGDYGLAGVMAFAAQANALHVDTFLLSCRVLGRGVEHQMWKALAKIALTRELNTLSIPFLPTPKNQPALDFLNKVGADYRQPYQQDGWLFVFPAQVAMVS